MKKSLVIVESPSKAKTINKFLGNEFAVKASIGHIRDLPQKDLGVDIENNFAPKYVAIDKQKKVIKELKQAAKKSQNIYIATDPDREGEAIAWHIAHELGRTNGKIFRALFNEITENAVQHAINNPLAIDEKKVDAQQTRRVLDRLVGYKVSPLLWKTLYRGSLSAGRVQSVVLKLICEREKKHNEFKPEEYWSIHVLLETPDNYELKAKITRYKNKKVRITNNDASNKLIEDFSAKRFIIDSIEKKKTKRNPQPPFITSTMQQEAANKLGFPPSKTMLVSQQLYEGLELGSEGNISLITYMRTDSVRISNEALNHLRSHIRMQFGKEYLSAKPRTFKTKKKGKIQDAHECIRPTYFSKPPDAVKQYLTKDQHKLYNLIWIKAIASQMENALFNQTTIKIHAGEYEFQTNGSEMVFPGFLILWQDFFNNGNNEEDNVTIPPALKEGMLLLLKNVQPAQHFTKPPPMYNDSSIVKELEQLGIGRPSTYAQIVSTLIQRQYINRQKRTLFSTELGKVVNEIVISRFPEVFNVDFTALMEQELDQIESGTKKYLDVVEQFYKPFNKSLEKALRETKEIKKSLEEKTGKTCPECGNELVIKWGKNGKFYACSGFPQCKHTSQIETQEKQPEANAGFKCDKCGSDMVERTGKYGKFYACSAYPKCKNIVKISTQKKSPPIKAGFKCEKCGKDMVIRESRRGKFYACSGYPKCKNTRKIAYENGASNENEPAEITGTTCEKCGRNMVIRTGKYGKFYACSGYPECKNTIKISANGKIAAEQ